MLDWRQNGRFHSFFFQQNWWMIVYRSNIFSSPMIFCEIKKKKNCNRIFPFNSRLWIQTENIVSLSLLSVSKTTQKKNSFSTNLPKRKYIGVIKGREFWNYGSKWHRYYCMINTFWTLFENTFRFRYVFDTLTLALKA